MDSNAQQSPASPQDTPQTPSAMYRDPRRVRFAIGSEASPTSTSSTLSSPGPHTPQQIYQPLVHIHQPSYTSSPSFSPTSFPLVVASAIHGALESPSYDFDTSLDPATNPAMRGNPYLESILASAASNPPLPTLSLVSRHLPWNLTIQRSSQPYVTVSDVLGGLHRALRISVTQAELERETEAKGTAIRLAHLRRCECYLPHNPVGAEYERSKGPRRIDFLVGGTHFKGLRKTENPTVWYMQLR